MHRTHAGHGSIWPAKAAGARGSDQSSLTPEWIAELRALLAKATPGPWGCVENAAYALNAEGTNRMYLYVSGGYETKLNNGINFRTADAEIAANAALIVAMRNALPALLDVTERASRARVDALREAARVAESLETLEAWLPTGPNGEGKDRHATIHGAKIAAAILALIDKPKGGDANEGRSGTTRETRHPATSPDVTVGASIPLTPAEIQSGMDRVRWAELLIRQLPKNHDGRNSWLLNYAAPLPAAPVDGGEDD